MNLDSAVEASAPRSGEREQADSASPAEFGMNFVPGWLGNRAAGALIFCLTLLAYLPSLSGDFIWNDSDYVTAPALRSLGGLAASGRSRSNPAILPAPAQRILGAAPALGGSPARVPYRHVAAARRLGGPVCTGLRRLLGNDSGPSTPLRAFDSGSTAAGHERRRYAGAEWLAALLFALHPAHVESVAWITEQKNTLSLAFYLAAALAYLRFDETRQPRTYVAALALFILSMLSKTVTATLPAALLVVLGGSAAGSAGGQMSCRCFLGWPWARLEACSAAGSRSIISLRKARTFLFRSSGACWLPVAPSGSTWGRSSGLSISTSSIPVGQ